MRELHGLVDREQSKASNIACSLHQGTTPGRIRLPSRVQHRLSSRPGVGANAIGHVVGSLGCHPIRSSRLTKAPGGNRPMGWASRLAYDQTSRSRPTANDQGEAGSCSDYRLKTKSTDDKQHYLKHPGDTGSQATQTGHREMFGPSQAAPDLHGTGHDPDHSRSQGGGR